MDRNIADLLGIDLDDPREAAEAAAVSRDMDLIETLVKTRVDLGLKQRDVAAQMGVSQPTVSDFERLGGDPHLSTVRRYALAIGVSVRHTVVCDGGQGMPRVSRAGEETVADAAQRAEFTRTPGSVYVAEAKCT